MTAKRRYALLTAIFIGEALPAIAQTPSSAPQAAATRAKIYLMEFEPGSEQDEQEARQELSKFATTLVQLTLAGYDQFDVARVRETPTCAEKPGEPTRQTRMAPTADSSSTYYLIQGSVSATSQPDSGSQEVVLSYRLYRIAGCVPQLIYRRSDPIRRDSALDSLTLMADVIGLRLRDAATQRLKVDVEEVQGAGSSSDEVAIASDLEDAILQRLGQSREFQPQDLRKEKPLAPDDYALRTKVEFGRDRTLLGLSSRISKVWVDLALLSGNKELWNLRLSKDVDANPSAQLAGLYREAAASVLQGLDSARHLREGNIDENPAKINDPGVLRSRAKELLCKSLSPDCEPQPDAALPLLKQLTIKLPDDVGAMELYGQAQYQTDDYLEAAQSFDQALSKATNELPKTTITLLNESGQAWYRAGYYRNAAQRYSKSVEEATRNKDALPPELQSQPQIRLQYARSLSFAGDRPEALHSLLDSLAAVNNPAPFNAELRNLFTSMQTSELVSSVGAIETARNRLAPEVVTAFYVQLANQVDWYGVDRENVEPLLLQASKADDALTLRCAVANFYERWASSSHGSNRNLYFQQAADMLQAVVAKDPTEVLALNGLMRVCTDYLNDFACALKAATGLEKAGAAKLDTDQLDVAEIYVLNGKYNDALRLITPIAANSSADPFYRAVAHFYQRWIWTVQGDRQAAEQAAAQWKVNMGAAAKSTSKRWYFGGARSALKSTQGIAPDDLKTFAEMMDVMEKPAAYGQKFQTR